MLKKYVFIVLMLVFVGGCSAPNNLGATADFANDQFEVVQSMTREEYNLIKESFLEIVRDQDPRVTLTALREEMEASKGILRFCHELTHEIGHEAFDKYEDFAVAMGYQDEVCNSGYLHGVIERYFEDSEGIETAMHQICEPYEPGKFLSWECYHGVGHGVMFFTENDLPKSLALCDSYQNAEARSSCLNGLFMENFNSDQFFHESDYLSEENPFYPCPTLADEYKRDWYFYAPTYYLALNRFDYADALKWCETAEPGYVGTCTAGVGSEAIKRNLKEPKLVEDICAQAAAANIPSCITGMTSLYIFHHAGLTEAEALCGELDPTNQKSCWESVDYHKRFF